jgi:ATP-dependent DNA helicase RecG
LERLRSTRGDAFKEARDEEVLEYVRVLDRSGGDVRVTLAGLETLGTYPQRYFPQLNVTFVSFATLDGTPMADGTRFLDNVAIDGPIPAMITQAVDVIRRNMTRRAVIAGVGRTDYWEYPEEAVRELVANALMHREYHPLGQGSQVRIEMYPDRLEVVSPGGLFGAFRPNVLGAETVTSSRNAVLGRLLEDIQLPGTSRMVCENRGTGLLAVSAALRNSGLEPTTIRDALAEFRVVLHREPILDGAVKAWLDTLPLSGLSQQQRLGLAYLHRRHTITNLVYRALTGKGARAAAKDLEALAGRGLVIRDNLTKSVKWRLNQAIASTDSRPSSALMGRKLEIVSILMAGPLSTAQIADRMRVSAGAVRHHIQGLEAAGAIAPTANKKSPLNKWVLVSPDERPES